MCGVVVASVLLSVSTIFQFDAGLLKIYICIQQGGDGGAITIVVVSAVTS